MWMNYGVVLSALVTVDKAFMLESVLEEGSTAHWWRSQTRINHLGKELGGLVDLCYDKIDDLLRTNYDSWFNEILFKDLKTENNGLRGGGWRGTISKIKYTWDTLRSRDHERRYSGNCKIGEQQTLGVEITEGVRASSGEAEDNRSRRIIVKFVRRKLREEFAQISMFKIWTEGAMYVNENLSKVFNAAREVKREKQYKFLWESLY